MQKQENIVLDLYATEPKITNFKYELNDKEVYPLFVTLKDRSGNFNIPQGATVQINFVSSVGEPVPDLCTIVDVDNGRLSYMVEPSKIARVGTVTANIQVFTATERLSYFQGFSFTVWQAQAGNGVIPPAVVPWTDSFNARLADHENRITNIEENGTNGGGGGIGQEVDPIYMADKSNLVTQAQLESTIADYEIVTPNALWVDQSRKDDDTNSEIGTMANPFVDIQDAYNAVDRDIEIQLSRGAYIGNLSWDKPYDVIITSDGTKGAYPVTIEGNFIVTGAAKMVAVQNMQINGDFTNNAPNSTFVPDNVRINRISNFNDGDYIIDDSYFNNINSTTLKSVTIRNSESEASGSWKFYGIGSRIRLTSIENLYADHVEGKMIIDGNTTFKPVSGNIGLRSSATNANGSTLSIVSGNFKQEDGTFAKCQKTGDCDYMLSSNVLLDRFSSFNGVRSFSGIEADQVVTQETPVNYIVADKTVKAHLEGIDEVIGEMNTSFGDVARQLQLFNGGGDPTILDQLARLNMNLQASYAASVGKGGVIPLIINFDRLAGTITSIPVGGGGAWQRPANRPDIGLLQDGQIKIVFGIGSMGNSGYCHKITTTAGHKIKTTWGDGAVTSTLSGAVTEHLYNWDTVVAVPDSRGYKLVVITIESEDTEPIIGIDLTSKPSWVTGTKWNPQAFELYIECPSLMTLTFPNVLALSANLSHTFVDIFYLGVNNLVACNYLLGCFYNLQLIKKLWVDKCSNIDYCLYRALSYNNSFPEGVNDKAFRTNFMNGAESFDVPFPDDWTLENCSSDFLSNTTFDQVLPALFNPKSITTNFLYYNNVFTALLLMAFPKATTGMLQFNNNFDTSITFDLTGRTMTVLDMSDRSNLRGLRVVGMGSSTTAVNIRNTRVAIKELRLLVDDLYDRTSLTAGTLTFNFIDAVKNMNDNITVKNEITALLVAKNWIAVF